MSGRNPEVLRHIEEAAVKSSFAHLAVFVGPAFLAACGALADGSDPNSSLEPHPEIGTAESSLLGIGTLWPNGIVPVCWETGLAVDGSGQAVNPHDRPDWDTLSAVVRDTMRDTWGRAAKLEFGWFQDCPANSAEGNAGYLAINMGGGNNASCGNAGIGYQGGQWTRMRLDTDCVYGNPDVWGEFRGQVIHETGHALGFQHEWDSAKNPHDTGCVVGDSNTENTAGNYYGTDFDPQSIMNYSYDEGCPLARPFRLSAWDIIGAQNAYGRHTPGALVSGVGSCLDVPLPYQPGNPLQIYQCKGSDNQVWSFPRRDGFLFTQAQGAYVDVPNGSNTPGVGLNAYSLNSPTSDNQTWHTSAGVQIRGIGDKCLDIPYGDIFPNQVVQITECNGGQNQLWQITSDGAVLPAADEGYCLDVPSGDASSGNLLQLYPCNGGDNQRFAFSNTGEITFGNLCLDATGGKPTDQSLIQLYECKGPGTTELNQQWHLTAAIYGSNGLCMEVQDGSSLNHTAIQQNYCTGGKGQEWDYYFSNF